MTNYSKSPPPSGVREALEIEFGYTNWEGRKSLRRARPISIRFGTSEWHPRPGWLMLAFDLDKEVEREFEMRKMEFEESALAAIALSPTPTVKPTGALSDLIAAIEAVKAKTRANYSASDSLAGARGYEGMAQAAGVANFVLTALIEELRKP